MPFTKVLLRGREFFDVSGLREHAIADLSRSRQGTFEKITASQYVMRHMMDVWRPLLFCDEAMNAKKTRDPVAPAQRSTDAIAKVSSKALDDGSDVPSFRTLLKAMSTIVRNVCRRVGASASESTFDVFTTPDPKQQRAYDLLLEIKV